MSAEERFEIPRTKRRESMLLAGCLLVMSPGADPFLVYETARRAYPDLRG